MAWYWWVVLAIVVAGALWIILVIVANANSAERRRDELIGMFAPHREEMARRESEGGRALELVLGLPIVADSGAAGQRQSRAQVRHSVMKLARTRHVRTHVVTAPAKVTFVQEFGARHEKAFAREFERIGEETWQVRTRNVAGFDETVRAAEAEAEASGAEGR